MIALLFDENLSHRLLPQLTDLYPGSTQVALAGLSGADDRTVWNHAKASGCTLVTKDDDFHHLAALYGPPPVVIRLAFGNCSNARIVEVLRARQPELVDQVLSGQVSVIELT